MAATPSFSPTCQQRPVPHCIVAYPHLHQRLLAAHQLLTVASSVVTCRSWEPACGGVCSCQPVGLPLGRLRHLRRLGPRQPPPDIWGAPPPVLSWRHGTGLSQEVRPTVNVQQVLRQHQIREPMGSNQDYDVRLNHHRHKQAMLAAVMSPILSIKFCHPSVNQKSQHHLRGKSCEVCVRWDVRA